MGRLTGIVLTQLIDVSVPQQPRWVGRTADGEDVSIKFENGTLIVNFSGMTDGFVESVNAPSGNLTTEVMLLLTGLRAL